MNKLGRHVLVGTASILLSPQLHAGGTLITKTGKFLFNTALRVSILPAALLSVPINMIGDALTSGKNNNQGTNKQQQQLLQPRRGGHSNQVLGIAQSQSVDPVNIPEVLQTALLAIPRDKEHPIYINLNLNNQHAAASTAAGTQPLRLPVRTRATQIKSVVGHSIFNVLSWIRSHKLRFTTLCTIGFYGGLQLYLWHLSRFLSHANCWACWKEDWALSALYQMSQKELLKSIMVTLQESYKENNPVRNAQRFIQEADHELCLLKRYQKITQPLHSWHLKRLFSINTSLLSTIPDRIQRLVFIKNTVLGWLTKHKEKYAYEKLFANTTDIPQA